ncbi:hypothetical protein [Candidatus Reidiella endopervernicosa]|uniref:Uncharacterized protein n=1 Tax=Candidatus Reidiella endopervernicosa TaxID=2738883 RepID=A0A6N0HT39_9GAMM|nr:hypothetical protein [Candidatus Reidiella endopervernicosa]QKQ25558.1 hypothetical protein HUE57_04015 [Candidatus Reidiella endopervernicosa]
MLSVVVPEKSAFAFQAMSVLAGVVVDSTGYRFRKEVVRIELVGDAL